MHEKAEHRRNSTIFPLSCRAVDPVRTDLCQLDQSIGQLPALVFQRQSNAVRWQLLLVLMLWLGVPFLGLAHKRGFAQWSRTLLVGLYSASLATLLILALCKHDSGVARLGDVPLRMLLAYHTHPGRELQLLARSRSE